MKIIGKTDYGFILEASKEDVAAMEGLYSNEKQFHIGDKIDIHELFIKYNTVRAALRDINKLRTFSQNIIDASDWIKEFQGE